MNSIFLELFQQNFCIRQSDKNIYYLPSLPADKKCILNHLYQREE